MAVNATGTFKRTADDEAEDFEQSVRNIKAQAWKSWPNKAVFGAQQERRGPFDLEVTGHIPSWVAGALYRTGPGQTEVETSKGTYSTTHWFDSLALTHKFDIVPAASPDAGATVTYSSHRHTKPTEDDIKRQGWRASVTFAQKLEPSVGTYAKMMAVYKPCPMNTNIVVERNVPERLTTVGAQTAASRQTGTRNLIAMSDISMFHELHPDTLEQINEVAHAKLHPGLNGQLSAAHFQRDPVTGDLYNYNLAFGRRSTYKVFRLRADTGAIEILATINSLPAANVHSLFLTQNYVILCVPTTHYGWNGLKIPSKLNFVESMEPFDKSKLMQWVVIDKQGVDGVVASFTTPAALFFHTVNSFEDETKTADGGVQKTISFDYIEYDNRDFIDTTYLDVLLDRDGAAAKQWVDKRGYDTSLPYLRRRRFAMPAQKPKDPLAEPAPASSTSLAFSIPSPHCGELPTINRSRATLPYRYVYMYANRGLSTLTDSIVKTDVETRDVTIWAAPHGHTPGEAIFVARPPQDGGGGAEDDGALLVMVLDGTTQTSYLLVLDARTMTEMGRAKADFPIPLGLHGFFAPRI